MPYVLPSIGHACHVMCVDYGAVPRHARLLPCPWGLWHVHHPGTDTWGLVSAFPCAVPGPHTGSPYSSTALIGVDGVTTLARHATPDLSVAVRRGTPDSAGHICNTSSCQPQCLQTCILLSCMSLRLRRPQHAAALGVARPRDSRARPLAQLSAEIALILTPLQCWVGPEASLPCNPASHQGTHVA